MSQLDRIEYLVALIGCGLLSKFLLYDLGWSYWTTSGVLLALLIAVSKLNRGAK